MILDGKIVANKIYIDIKNDIKTNLYNPKLVAILVGNSKSSIRYINQKEKWSKKVGIDFELIHFDENITQEKILKQIEILNNDDNVSGFIVQLPLPSHIDEQKIINSINSLKDVDGFTQINQGKVLIGENSGLKPCTPAGILKLLDFYNIDVVGKNICVIGRSNIVGKPITNMLINAQASVSCLNSKTKNMDFYTKNSDILITAVGKPGIIKKENINDKTIVIDVGFSIIDEKIYGDANFEEIEKNGNMITPVPGGVGTLTVACLLDNTLKAYKIQKGKF